MFADSIVYNAFVLFVDEDVLGQNVPCLYITHNLITEHVWVAKAAWKRVIDFSACKLRIVVHHTDLGVHAVEPAVVRGAIARHDVDGMNWFIFYSSKIVCDLPVALMVTCHDSHDDELNEDEELNAENRNNGNETVFLNLNCEILSNHDESKGDDREEEPHFLVRDGRKNYKIEDIVISQIRCLALAPL